MENLFQLLIFLFIVYSIISALSGKKKPQDKTIPKTEDYKGGDTKTSPQDSTGDIIGDLFGLRLPKKENDYREIKSKPSVFNRKPEDVSIPEGTELPNDPKLEDARNIIESEQTKAYDATFSFNQRTIELKKKMKSPETFKELFLISEILNKPKSLRR